MRTKFDAYDIPLSVDYYPNARGSRIYNGTMPEPYAELTYFWTNNDNITHNDHGYGFKPDIFNEDPYLSSNFTVLGTSKDIYGYVLFFFFLFLFFFFFYNVGVCVCQATTRGIPNHQN